QNNDQLPPDPLPWSRRRLIYVNQRDAMIRLAIMMENAARHMNDDITAAEAAKRAVRAAASDPAITKEELVMLDDDYKEWDTSEDEAHRWQDGFNEVARRAKKTAELFAAMIEAGDNAEKEKKK